MQDLSEEFQWFKQVCVSDPTVAGKSFTVAWPLIAEKFSENVPNLLGVANKAMALPIGVAGMFPLKILAQNNCTIHIVFSDEFFLVWSYNSLVLENIVLPITSNHSFSIKTLHYSM